MLALVSTGSALSTGQGNGKGSLTACAFKAEARGIRSIARRDGCLKLYSRFALHAQPSSGLEVETTCPAMTQDKLWLKSCWGRGRAVPAPAISAWQLLLNLSSLDLKMDVAGLLDLSKPPAGAGAI